MKREILCTECAEKRIKNFGMEKSGASIFTADPYPQEHVKLVQGKAVQPFICDYCAVDIMPEEKCFASSIWADHGAQPYYEWEDEFITIKKEKEDAKVQKETSSS